MEKYDRFPPLTLTLIPIVTIILTLNLNLTLTPTSTPNPNPYHNHRFALKSLCEEQGYVPCPKCDEVNT